MVKWISQRSSEPSFQVRILVGAQKIEQSESFYAPKYMNCFMYDQDSNRKPVHKIRGANTCRFSRGRETIFLLSPKDEKKKICLVTEYPGANRYTWNETDLIPLF